MCANKQRGCVFFPGSRMFRQLQLRCARNRACLGTVAYRKSGAALPLSGGAGQRAARVPARVPIRLPRRPSVQAQVRAERQPSDLFTHLRRLPAVSVREAPRGFDHHEVHGLSALDARQRGSGLSCEVCGAPALPLDGACVFCHAALHEHDEPIELLDYLAERIPIAKANRAHLNPGPIIEVVIEVAGRTFRARWNKEELEFHPPALLTAWLDLLPTPLSDPGAARADLRPAVPRSRSPL